MRQGLTGSINTNNIGVHRLRFSAGPTPQPATFPIWVVLIVLIIQFVIFVGPFLLAYASAGLISRLFRKRKTLANLTKIVTWTILVPLLFSFSTAYYVIMVYSSEPWRDQPNLTSTFFNHLVVYFVYYPQNVFFLLIWLIGATFMFRKNLWSQLSLVVKEKTKLMNEVSVSSP